MLPNSNINPSQSQSQSQSNRGRVTKRKGYRRSATSLDSTPCRALSGYLKKKSSNGLWQTRFFRLNNQYLLYYKSEEQEQNNNPPQVIATIE